MSRVKGSIGLSTEEIAKAKTLAAMGCSFRQIGRELKRSDHTIKKLLSAPAVAEEVSNKKLELADLFEQLSRRTLEEVSLQDIRDASLQQKAVSSGIFIDKARLLRDQSTANINVSALLDLAQLFREDEAQRQAELAARRRAEHGLPPASPTN